MRQFPALALLGPRQVGKTTLARRIANDLNGVVFDLERASDRLKLNDPELALGAFADRLVVLDEVQRTPGLFETLRPLIDEQRRPGRFLLLGSASPALLRQASYGTHRAWRRAWACRPLRSAATSTRDSGLLLSLLDVRSLQQLAGHPVAGALWEGTVIEQLISAKPPSVQANFYRTARGAEVDLVLHSSRVRVAIECKFSSSPKPARGFHEAMAAGVAVDAGKAVVRVAALDSAAGPESHAWCRTSIANLLDTVRLFQALCAL